MVIPGPAVQSEQIIRAVREAKPSFSRWPVRAASLRALSELGLSDLKIANYLKVDTGQVASLRSAYGIAEGQWKA